MVGLMTLYGDRLRTRCLTIGTSTTLMIPHGPFLLMDILTPHNISRSIELLFMFHDLWTHDRA